MLIQYILLMTEMDNKEENKAEGAEEIGLTYELVKDLVELLGNPSLEVRHGTISAILQYTPTTYDRLLFRETNLIPLLRKYLFQPKLTKICLSSLIHFASEPENLGQYFKLIEPMILKMKEWNDLELELSLLLILNISQEQQIIVRIISDSDQAKRGYLMEILYSIYQNKPKYRWIVVNVFVNITTIERGRKFLVEDKFYIRLIPEILNFDEKLRQSCLKIVRNCSFQWEIEEFLTDLLSEKLNLINSLGKLMTFLIHKNKLIKDPKHIQFLNKKYFSTEELQKWDSQFKIASEQKAISQVETAIDIVLILSNGQLKTKAIGVDTSAFKELLSALKFTTIDEETKDKLQALEIFCF